MNYTTRNAHEAIRAQRNFKSGAMLGVNVGDDYIVKSYAVEIARWSPGKGWTVNDEKYSVTTSRHQSQVRRAIN